MSTKTKRIVAAVSLICALNGCVSVDMQSLLSPRLEEVVLRQGKGFRPDRILMLDISGLITSAPGHLFSPVDRCSPDTVAAILQKAAADSRIKAVILRIDSPGGDVAASDAIYHELQTFKEESGLPMVAAVVGIGCSGGYYVACAADEIYTQPTAVTGSIGVIAVFPKLRELADKVGYDQVVIKSGDMKDMGNPLKSMSPEEQEVFQRMIDSFYARFRSVVAESRGQEKGKGVLDGRILTAEQAVEAGLTDGVKYLDQIIADVEKQSAIEGAEVFTYSFGMRQDASLYSRTAKARQKQVFDMKLPLTGLSGKAGFYYLWQP